MHATFWTSIVMILMPIFAFEFCWVKIVAGTISHPPMRLPLFFPETELHPNDATLFFVLGMVSDGSLE